MTKPPDAPNDYAYFSFAKSDTRTKFPVLFFERYKYIWSNAKIFVTTYS